MTGWFEYGVFIGATTVVTIILKKLECNYYDNGVTIEMIVEITRRASQAHILIFYICKSYKNYFEHIYRIYQIY